MTRGETAYSTQTGDDPVALLLQMRQRNPRGCSILSRVRCLGRESDSRLRPAKRGGRWQGERRGSRGFIGHLSRSRSDLHRREEKRRGTSFIVAGLILLGTFLIEIGLILYPIFLLINIFDAYRSAKRIKDVNDPAVAVPPENML